MDEKYKIIKIREFSEEEKFQNGSEAFIIKRFVMIEKSGSKGTYPKKWDKQVYRDYTRQLNGRLFYNNSWLKMSRDTCTLEALEDTIAYYEDLQKSLKFLNTKIISWS